MQGKDWRNREMTMDERNWAGNYTYTAGALHRPGSMDELREIVRRSTRIRVLGTRHSFNDLPDSAALVSLERIETPVEIDRDAMTVTVDGAMRYGDLAQELMRHDLALHAMASLPHISVAGAIATATHGSGDRCGNLATAVAALEVMGPDGELRRYARGDDDFPGMVVGLGATGVVTRVTLDVEPGYEMRQQVFEFLPWEMMFDRFDEVTSAAESVSLFSDYGESVRQVWLKERVTPGEDESLRDAFLGASAATRPMHPVPEMDASACTAQIGEPGPWAERLPHFRLDAVPSSGDELQSEYLVAREHAVDAIHAVRSLSERLRPHLHVSEIRTIASDDLWLSAAFGQDCIGIHFTWKPHQDAVMGLLPVLEETLAPFSPRPHWGKVFVASAEDLEGRYPKMAAFRDLLGRVDPGGKFRNGYLERVIGRV